jgi:parallel beta-helix repeat protein
MIKRMSHSRLFLGSFAVICFVVLFIGVGIANAATYYVSTSGNDGNNGLSLTTAWRTIQHAADTLKAGDTVNVQSGTYNEKIVETTNGTANNRIIYQGVNNPVINSGGNTGFLIQGDYVTITGFTIRNATNYGVWINQADYANVSYNIMDDFSCDVGILVYGQDSSPYTPVYYPTIDHNIIKTSCHAIELEYGIYGGSVSYNTLDTNNNGCDTILMWGTASQGLEDPPSYGWKYHMSYIGNIIRNGRNGFGGGAIYNCTIKGNDIESHYHNGLNLHSTQSSTIVDNIIRNGKGGDTQHGIYIDGSSNYWRNNYFNNNTVVAQSTGVGFNVGNAVNCTVENLTMNSASEGILLMTSKEGTPIVASGNWSFRNVSLVTNEKFGVRFTQVNGQVFNGTYNFSDVNMTVNGAPKTGDWCIDSPNVRPVVTVINSNAVIGSWISGGNEGDFRFYYPLDVLVKDANGIPIEGATVTITNLNNSNYPSKNDNWEDKTTFITGANGHTPLPSDRENSAAVIDFRLTSTGSTYFVHTITAQKDGYSTSITVNPNSSWYRPNPNTYQDTVTIVFNLVHNLNTSESFPTIQEAIDDSNTQPGHTISVDPGTYTENVKVNKSLTIHSASGNPTDTIVQAGSINDHVFNVTADYVNITGLTVTNATADGKAGIYLSSSTHCNISNNNISKNYYGISLNNSNNNTVRKNTVLLNTWCGIYLNSSSNNFTCNWVAYNNKWGFYLTGISTGNVIEDNNIMVNGEAVNNSWHYNFYNNQSNDVSAENNYWGTNDAAIIEESIFDKSDDPSKGMVDFSNFRSSPAPGSPIPELPSIILFSTGLLALAGYSWLRRKIKRKI